MTSTFSLPTLSTNSACGNMVTATPIFPGVLDSPPQDVLKNNKATNSTDTGATAQTAETFLSIGSRTPGTKTYAPGSSRSQWEKSTTVPQSEQMR